MLYIAFCQSAGQKILYSMTTVNGISTEITLIFVTELNKYINP